MSITLGLGLGLGQQGIMAHHKPRTFSESDSLFYFEGGLYICSKIRCGARFQSDIDAQEHWKRKHSKLISSSIVAAATVSLLQSSTQQERMRSSGTFKGGEQDLKLPIINTSQLTLKREKKEIGLHPSIRDAIEEQLPDPIKLSNGFQRRNIVIPDKKPSNGNKGYLQQPFKNCFTLSRPGSQNSSPSHKMGSSIKQFFIHNQTPVMQEDNLLALSNAILNPKPSPNAMRRSYNVQKPIFNQLKAEKIQGNGVKEADQPAPLIKRTKGNVITFGKNQNNVGRDQTPDQLIVKDQSDQSKINKVEQKVINPLLVNVQNMQTSQEPNLDISLYIDDEQHEEQINQNKVKVDQLESLQEQVSQPELELTEEIILQMTGCSNLGDVDQLIIRNNNVNRVEDNDRIDWSELSNICYLSISHNPNLIDISGVSSIPDRSLIELNLEYNQIENISPILRHQQLQKLFLSGNRITSIQGITSLKSLSTLCLMKNTIRNFHESLEALASLPCLVELELEQNPISSRLNYKHDFLWKLKLLKLDGEPVNELDLELSRNFQSEYRQFCLENPKQIPAQVYQKRPLVVKTSNRNLKVINGIENSLSVITSRDIQKKEGGECMKNIDEDIADALEEEEALERELLGLQLEGRALRYMQIDYEEEAKRLTSGISEKSQLIEDNNKLQHKQKDNMKNLNNMNNLNHLGSQFISAIYKLNLKIEDVSLENQRIEQENQEILRILTEVDNRGESALIPEIKKKKEEQKQENEKKNIYVRGENNRKEQNQFQSENEDEEDENDNEKEYGDQLNLSIGFDSDG